MCGISGIINLTKNIMDIELLYKMTELVRYRGPDDMGMVLLSSKYTNDLARPIQFRSPEEFKEGDRAFSDYDIGFGHQRLKIIDLSERGHQPMSNEDGSLWIVHNGEIYNYIEIRRELVLKGYKFRSNTDTEVILNAYQEWGTDCLNKFNGMWAFAIWDNVNKTLFCSRDRFGIKPFYYYLNDNIFIFSSEVKQILEYEKYQKKPNDKMIYDFLVIGLEDHTNETFFEGIYQLRGGEYAVLDFDTKKFNKGRFYDLGGTREIDRDESDYYECFKDLFFDSIDIRLRSDVPVGSCLSGGLDSSAVVCTISEIFKSKGNGDALETFTACWEDEKINERTYSEQVVTYTKAKGNNVFPSHEELQQDLSRLIWHQEEPFGSLSIFAQWSVMKAARKSGIPVLLDGQGGDEVFLGYERYYAWSLMELLKQFRFKRLVEEVRKGAENSKLSLLEIIQYYFYFSFNRIRASRLKKVANAYMNNEFMRGYDVLARLNSFTKAKTLLDTQKNEIQEIQLSHLLKYADRNSMAFSIESRLPFLDYRLVEFGLSVPSEYKIRKGWTKNIIRQGMKGTMPDRIRKRINKIGFEVPQAILLKAILPFAQTGIEKDAMIEKYIDHGWLMNKIKTKDLSEEIVWKALCLELWLREFFG